MRSPRHPGAFAWFAGAGLAAAVLAGAAGSAGEAPASADPVPGVDAAPPPGPSVDTRLREIQRRVQAALIYPRAAERRGVEGETQVEFVVGADGLARDVRTRASSGSPVLDHAAERAVRDAGALPYVYGVLVVPVRFAIDAHD